VHDIVSAGVRVRREGRREVVDFGNGVVVAASGRFTVTEGLPFPVELSYRWSEAARRFVIYRLEGEALTGEVIRQIPVDRLLTIHLAEQGGRQEGDRRARESELAEVANIYARAFAAHRPPVVAVAETLGIPYSTANKKVVAARKAGLLPKTNRRKAKA
jgi:hypothetical protein